MQWDVYEPGGVRWRTHSVVVEGGHGVHCAQGTTVSLQNVTVEPASAPCPTLTARLQDRPSKLSGHTVQGFASLLYRKEVVSCIQSCWVIYRPGRQGSCGFSSTFERFVKTLPKGHGSHQPSFNLPAPGCGPGEALWMVDWMNKGDSQPLISKKKLSHYKTPSCFAPKQYLAKLTSVHLLMTFPFTSPCFEQPLIFTCTRTQAVCLSHEEIPLPDLKLTIQRRWGAF